MIDVTAAASVPAPPELVWDLLCDTSRYAEWVVGTDEVTRTDGPAREGSAYDEVNTIAGPWRARTSWRVVEFAPLRRQVHRSTDVPLFSRFDVVLEVEPRDGGTLVTLGLRGTPRPGIAGAILAWPVRRAAERSNRRTLGNLARLVSRSPC